MVKGITKNLLMTASSCVMHCLLGIELLMLTVGYMSSNRQKICLKGNNLEYLNSYTMIQ